VPSRPADDSGTWAPPGAAAPIAPAASTAPAAAPAVTPAAAGPAPDDLDDVDDAPTVGLAQVRAAQAAASEAARPHVQAVHCPAGHPNPPYGEACRVCSQPIADRSVTTIVRPVLGVLRPVAGEDIALDGPLLIGRKPTAGTLIEGEPARVVRLPDPDTVLSRTHLEVRLVDWQVQVVDRDSMNHTYVTVPGQAPTQLRPTEPYPIPVGTVVSLGDAVQLTYEVPR
jgi:hypothetical protein